MAGNTVSDAFAQASGNVLIDSVVYVGLPLWTSESPSSGLTVTYAFMTTPLLPSDVANTIDNFAPLNSTQQSAVRLIYGTSQSLTGLTFLETADTQGADIVFGTEDIDSPFTMALTYSDYDIRFAADGSISALDRKDYVYFDNVEWYDVMVDPVPGSLGYETILHEIGHTLGLDDTAYTQTLPSLLDNTDVTVMSYHETDTYKANFSVLDVAALHYLYADSGTIRDFGLTPVAPWPGTGPSVPGTMLAVA
ncbi:zinc metalloprotease [Solidesulfovibrio sp.]